MKIKILNDELVYDGKFIQTIRRHYRTKTGGKKFWEMVKRSNSHRIISVIGLTPKKEIILIKIYRIPIKSYAIETIMGLTDKKGENLIETVKRELLEETGYQAKRIIRLIESPHNSGLSAWPVTFYAALDAIKLKKPSLEVSEDISVLKIPAKKILSYLLHPPRKMKVDIKVFGVLQLLSHKKFIKL